MILSLAVWRKYKGESIQYTKIQMTRNTSILSYKVRSYTSAVCLYDVK